ncbi:MAG TPA: replicative DNA helicase [Spirochaetota bacterium]|nr:replicative DNA helicase [Spirochaetota bacterium]
MTSQIIPFNLEAEIACLGSILLKNSTADTVFAHINPEDFYDGRNKLIAETIREHVVSGTQQPIDIITLTDELNSRAKLGQAGGNEYISGLIDSVPTTSNVEHYAELIKNKATLRKLIESGNQIIGMARDSELSVEQALDKAQQAVFDIDKKNYNEYDNITNVLKATVNKLEQNYHGGGKSDIIKTGFRDLDELLGGLHKGNLIVIGGRPSMGKTALAVNIMENIAIRREETQAVGYFSMEMSKEELCIRLLCSQARIPSDKFRKDTLADNDWPRLIEAADRIYKTPVYLDETSNLSLAELTTKARKMVKQENVKLIIVDYLQLMETPNLGIPREQFISSLSRGLKRLARQLEIPIIALTQLNRTPDKRDDKRPFLSDIRESGAIEQDADIVCLVHRQSVYEPDNEEVQNRAEIMIAKNRHGEIKPVTMTFLGAFTRFENFEPDE